MLKFQKFSQVLSVIRTELFKGNLFAKVLNDVGNARFAGVEAHFVDTGICL